MRILHIINNLATGGAERLVSDLLPIFIQNNGIKVDLFLLQNKPSIYIDKIEKAGIKIYYSKNISLYNPLHIFYIRRIMNKYDIIHTHLFQSQYWTILASMFTKKNKLLITTEHNTTNRRRKYKIFKYIDQFIYDRYHKIISISTKTNLLLNKWLKLKKDKCVIINNGVDIEYFKSAIEYNRKNIGYCNDDIIVTMVARFDKQKDQETCIKSLKYLEDKVKILFIGNGVNIDKCKELAIKLNVDKRIKFLGEQSDVARYLKMSDICVLSSNWEGFGLVAVEYMAAGKPVIASDVPGLKEVVEGYGMIFKLGDSIDLANKINILIKNKEINLLVREKCIKRSECFSIYSTAEKYLAIYQSHFS